MNSSATSAGGGVSATAEEFSSGKITYLLNEKSSVGDLAWYQNIENDAFPTLDNTHQRVYVTLVCHSSYYNEDGIEKDHVWDSDGICTACGAYHTATLVANDNYESLNLTADFVGYYAISNIGELYWFADLVNNGTNTVNAVLTNDIVGNAHVLTDEGKLNGDGSNFRSWTPIGTSSKKYQGIFDGNGYTISGLYFKNTTSSNYPNGGNYVGLFGYADGGTIKNVGVIDSYFEGKSYIGSICGYSNNGTITNCFNTGTISTLGNYIGCICGYSNNGTITKCYNTGTIPSANGDVGGICGDGYGSTITKCYNTGAITTSGGDVGGICGSGSNCTISNCYNTGAITCRSYYVGGICGNYGSISYCYNTGTVKGSYYYVGAIGGKPSTMYGSCYYISGCAKDGRNTTQYGAGASKLGTSTSDNYSRSSEAFSNGSLTYYYLNGGTSTGNLVWYQTLGEDATPVLDDTHGVVYASAICGKPYNNIATDLPHDYDEHGLCTRCGDYHAPTLVSNENYESLGVTEDFVGYYAISNMGELYWFANRVNIYSTTINAVLTTDIVVNENVLTAEGGLNGDGSNFRSWTPIGTSSQKYQGVFDGNGHTISGLYQNVYGSYKGLFGYASGGTIKNVGVIDSYIKCTSYVGGICGYGNDATITNCYYMGYVYCSSQYVGGICGYGSNSTITNCYNTGYVYGYSQYVGGICGYGSNSTITNCYNTGYVYGYSQYVGGICGYDGTIAKCYNTGNVKGNSYYVGAICGQGGVQTNCYYLAGCAKDKANIVQNGMGASSTGTTSADVEGNIASATADEFAGGKIGYLLNGSDFEGTTWYQTLYSDASPVLDNTHNRITGYTVEEDNVITTYNDVLIGADYEIPADKTFYVPTGTSLTTTGDAVITNSGVLRANGTLAGNNLAGDGSFVTNNGGGSGDSFTVANLANTYEYKGSDYTIENGLSGVVISVGTVTKLGKVFVIESDNSYSVSYENNRNIGSNATIIFTNTEDENDVITGTFAIVPKTITVTNVVAANKDYDGNATATGSYSYESEVVAGENVTIDYTASFADAKVGEGKTVTFNFTMSGDDMANYTLASTTATATANITPATVTLTNLTVADKVYDGATNATYATFTTIGIVGEEDVFVNYTATFENENVGENKNVSVTFELAGENIANYTLATATATAKANITPASLTITNITVDDKVYDGTTAAKIGDYTSTGVLEGDEVTITPTAHFADKNVGEDKTVTCSFVLSGDDAANYKVIATEEPTADISVKTISINDIVAEDKFYDGSATATLLFTPDGIVENDAVTIEYTANFNDATIGEDKEVTYSFVLSGDDKDNYVLANSTGSTTANISVRAITISDIVAENKAYDGSTTATLTYNVDGLQNGDDVTVGYTATFDDKNVGEGIKVTYNITISGADVDKYEFTEISGETTANITSAVVSIDLTVDNKAYDGTTTATATFTTTGIVNDEDVTVNYTATFEDKNVGENKNVSITFELAGEDIANYTLASETATATADITPAPVSVTELTVANKVYDGATNAIYATFTAIGIVGEEDVFVNYTATFEDENVGENKNVSLAFDLAGEDIANYTLATATATATANITAKSIVISEVVAENKEYDGNATANGTFTTAGVLDGEDVTVEYTAAFADKTVGEDKTVTFSFSLNGEDKANYALANETAAATANITAKSIAISEIATENKEYDGTTTAIVSYKSEGAIENDDVTIEPTAAFADKNVGEDKVVTYSFAKSGEDADNYVLSVEPTELKANITAKSIAISEIAAENKEYDGTTTAIVSYKSEGAIENDDITIVPTATFANKNVGEDIAVTYSFVVSGEDADNYVLSVETVELKANITAKSIAISEIAAENKEYDGTATATGTFTTARIVENDNVTVEYTAAFADANVGAEKEVTFTFSLSGDDKDNYVLASETATAKANITAKSIAVNEIVAENKVYDGNATATGTFTTTGALENDDVTVEYTAAFADANVGAEKEVTFTFSLSGDDKDNYVLVSETATAKASISANTSVVVTITENSAAETYDGTEKTVTGYAVEISTELYKESDFIFNGTAEAKGTDAGEYEMNVAASDFENTNANFAEVTFSVVDGKLTIEKSAETPNMPELTTETRLLNITDVVLPEGWAWADETLGLEEGDNQAVANYVGDDAGNYTVESVTITITRLPCLHDGEYTIVDAKEATCTADGYTGDHKCSICGVIFEQGSVIPAEGHKAGEPVVENYVAPTCTEAGTVDTVVYCTIDNEEISRKTSVLPATGHIAGEAVVENYVAPTCTEAGTVDTVYYCTIDGDLISRETYVLEAKGHQPGEKVAENLVPATISTEGSVDSVTYCTVCGEELSREHFVLPILDHEHIAGAPVEENRVEPTCTVDGSVDTVVYCTVNGEELSREHYVLPALGHKPSEKVAKNYVAPTCTEAGSVDSVVTCMVCGEVLSDEHYELPATGHIAGEPVIENYIAPTCTEAGTVDTVYYCTIDGDLISRETYELPALGHKAGEPVEENRIEPTCTKAGSVDTVVYCTVCGEELSRQSYVLPMLEHVAGKKVAENYVAPTKTEEGSVDSVVYCTIGGEELSRESFVLPAIGHDHILGEPVAENYKAPTCTEAGSVDTVIYCMVEGEELSRETYVLPALGHTAGEAVIENYVAPTCTTTGTVDTVYYCTIDNELISRETYVLPMLEHVPGEKVAENYVAPTFTAVGSVDSVVYCTIGGEELSRETFELPMLQKAIEKIEVLSMPKTEYTVGDEIDITGAKISVTFNDGTVEEIDLTNDMLSGFDNTLVAEQDITITYLTFTTTIHVTVNEKTAVSDITADATSIYAFGHTIVVETTAFIGSDIMVYDINGRTVAKVSANDERTEINVPRTGVYGVRIENVSTTIMVR